MSIDTKPHIVCIPFAQQGHINPLLKLAKLLHHKGFYITFVNTESNHKRILESRGPNALNAFPDFCFETIPFENHPPSNNNNNNNNSNLVQHLFSLRLNFRESFLISFRNLLEKLKNKADADDHVPPVTCIIADGVLNSAVTVAEELGIPIVLFWNIAASGVTSYIQYRQLMAKCVKLLQGGDNRSEDDDEGLLDTTIDWLPGMKGITIRELPNLIPVADPINFLMESSIGELERTSKAAAHICHTFETLEIKNLNILSSIFPQVYSIGPLELLLNHQIQDNTYKTLKCNFWDESESECIQWLDSQEPNSVIYVSFGSFIVLSSEKLIELAWGLANSKFHFLWVIRQDLVMGESAILPKEFLVEIKERGFIASWCPQEQVLNHPSIAGFMSHSGWNSTIESICGGVPMICWPVFGEHFVNSKNSCNEWGIGIELSNEFTRDEVEKVLIELVVKKKGKIMKMKTMEWKHKAEEAIDFFGSSTLNFNKLVNDVLLAKS